MPVLLPVIVLQGLLAVLYLRQTTEDIKLAVQGLLHRALPTDVRLRKEVYHSNG